MGGRCKLPEEHPATAERAFAGPPTTRYSFPERTEKALLAAVVEKTHFRPPGDWVGYIGCGNTSAVHVLASVLSGTTTSSILWLTPDTPLLVTNKVFGAP